MYLVCVSERRLEPFNAHSAILDNGIPVSEEPATRSSDTINICSLALCSYHSVAVFVMGQSATKTNWEME